MNTSVRSTFVSCAALCMLAACNPVVDNAVDDLGGEAPGVHPGPQHRPGQPCLLCHDGSLGNPPEFSVAGTVFQTPSANHPASRALVELQNADGSAFETTTNSAGNFYLQPSMFKPKFPLQVKVRYQGEEVTMHSTIGREGACAGCHSDPAGPDSPGHVYVQLDDGGVPP
jgi:hypothetical protein